MFGSGIHFARFYGFPIIIRTVLTVWYFAFHFISQHMYLYEDLMRQDIFSWCGS